ncbi:hypothetical protein GGR28_003772 [Lewinella aquimaris]|uniref:Uncharacterized protein n=1 Tax=Neolewinella aquimaris TaxID=1835722 RepID=A0A840EC87_9BACT|nr:hypothetical protein [Neolewinella aquimaris]MBB4081125.1 hypothetical protein [Neolewinella aquimaris]
MLRFKLIFLSLLCCCYINGQEAPRLALTGTNPSFSKGTIDTELLSSIIQSKQEEVKERLLRNTIIAQFKKEENNYTKRLNNFTTFSYMYNLLNTITTGKNKSAMTKLVIESTSEFAFIYGLAYLNFPDVITSAKATSTKSANQDIQNIVIGNVEDFNILIDLCYDIVYNRKSELANFMEFKNRLSDASFDIWYEADNAYKKAIALATDKSDVATLQRLGMWQQTIDASLTELIDLETSIRNTIEAIELLGDNGISSKWNRIINGFASSDGSTLADIVKDLIAKNSGKFDPTVLNYLQTFEEFLSNDYDNAIYIYSFYRGLAKSNFKDFSLTEDQFYGLKYIIVKFIEIAKNQYPNDAISGVLEYLLENTLVEFLDSNGDLVPNEDLSTKGYIYLDVESLISSIDSWFNSIKPRKISKYVSPFLIIGANYGVFFDENQLLPSSQSSTIGNLYYAVEKIGIKYKIWNYKYTHSFEPGVSVSYYGKNFKWRRPQEEPLISDIYVYSYFSGILYNLVDVKSEENFDYALFGGGLGVTFFNGLNTNFSLSSPITDGSINNKNIFFNVGIDIPIIDYISELTKRR